MRIHLRTCSDAAVDAKPAACPQCGGEVDCAVAQGRTDCWCFHEQAVGPLDDVPADRCLCKQCLRQRLAAADLR